MQPGFGAVRQQSLQDVTSASIMECRAEAPQVVGWLNGREVSDWVVRVKETELSGTIDVAGYRCKFGTGWLQWIAGQMQCYL